MKAENQQLNEQESIKIIAQMIQNTQERMKKNSGLPFLIWGYGTIIISLAVWYLLLSTGNPYYNFIWFALPAICTPLTIAVTRKADSEGYIKTYIDRVTGYIWIIFGIGGFLVSILPGILVNITSIRFNYFPILFIVLLLMGMGTALTGLVIKFKPCIIGGIVAMILSFLVLIFTGVNSILVFAGLFIPMMIIPGHILNHTSKKGEKC